MSRRWLEVEPITFSEFLEQMLDTVLLLAEQTGMSGARESLPSDLMMAFDRRLDRATVSPLPLMALRDEARVAYLAALHVVSTSMQMLAERGVHPGETAREILTAAEAAQ